MKSDCQIKQAPPANADIKSYLYSAGLFLLIMLWSYALFIKIADLHLYKLQMAEQPFPKTINTFLTYFIPIIEGSAAVLLILGFYRLGLWTSMLLLLGFSVYVVMILMKFFPKVPCSCGGFISKMSWQNHLYFNMGLILINIFCLYWLSKMERRSNGNE